jgi:hypothetical protein
VGVPGVQVTLTNLVLFAAGHNHAPLLAGTQPGPGTFSPNGGMTDGTGVFTGVFNPSEFASAQRISGSVSYRGDQMTLSPQDIEVRGFDQVGLFAPSAYITEVGASAEHPDNHWGNPLMNQYLLSLASYYVEDPQNPSKSPFPVNDQSLVWGGKFDASPPHNLHRAGLDADIGDTTGRVPLVLSKAHIVALAKIIDPGVVECHPGTSAIHLRLIGPCR